MPREFAFPGTRDRYAPSRVCDIQHYRIDLDLDIENKSLRGRCEITLSALGRSRSFVELDAVELEIETVCCEGAELVWSHDGKKVAYKTWVRPSRFKPHMVVGTDGHKLKPPHSVDIQIQHIVGIVDLSTPTSR